MDTVYTIVENGELYPAAYKRYTSALRQVYFKYRKEIDEKDGIEHLNIPESQTGVTYIYIEKAIHIHIYKMPVRY
jgi:hypothetical protein